jgi:hypothetical protein
MTTAGGASFSGKNYAAHRNEGSSSYSQSSSENEEEEESAEGKSSQDGHCSDRMRKEKMF